MRRRTIYCSLCRRTVSRSWPADVCTVCTVLFFFTRRVCFVCHFRSVSFCDCAWFSSRAVLLYVVPVGLPCVLYVAPVGLPCVVCVAPVSSISWAFERSLSLRPCALARSLGQGSSATTIVKAQVQHALPPLVLRCQLMVDSRNSRTCGDRGLGHRCSLARRVPRFLRSGKALSSFSGYSSRG